MIIICSSTSICSTLSSTSILIVKSNYEATPHPNKPNPLGGVLAAGFTEWLGVINKEKTR
jgi:hypothetical protein